MQIILWNDDQGRVVALTPPGGMTAEEAKKDGGMVPQDRPTFIKDNATLPSEPLSAWRMDGAGNLTTIDLPAPVPQIVTSGAFIRAAHEQDWLDGIETAVAAAGQQNSLIPLLWARSSQFERPHPFVALIGQAMGKTSAEIDDLFRLAGSYDT